MPNLLHDDERPATSGDSFNTTVRFIAGYFPDTPGGKLARALVDERRDRLITAHDVLKAPYVGGSERINAQVDLFLTVVTVVNTLVGAYHGGALPDKGPETLRRALSEAVKPSAGIAGG